MNIKVPSLAEGVNEAIITVWLVKKGDHVRKGQDIVEMATDKAAFNMPSPIDGVVKAVYFEEGQTVKVGDVLLDTE